MANFFIFAIENFLGIERDMIAYSGFTPFEAKSLTQETKLFLEISLIFIPGGTSVLSTNMSDFVTMVVLPSCTVSTSSGTNLDLLPKLF